MTNAPTEHQDGEKRRRSMEMSRSKANPPSEVPGYEPEQFLGGGAYGEVWVARERNTGRQVAIKFYAHRGGLDWSLLSREVEKLAFLFADRYVVQLLSVGWDGEPPYYIMEYLPHGSLAEKLQQGPMPVDEAIAMFREVATGLLHAHGKGVLHCDLKPANILLDEDNRPRLADFGQSRLSHEQTPALGTLYYMAPEQADLEAVPEVRWDVYALGALLYRMLTGEPPYRSGDGAIAVQRAPNLNERLHRYRQLIEEAPVPSAHRQTRGVDGALAEIVDRCLTADPEKRFPNVQAVLEALDVRETRRSRRPLTILGAVGPALLLAVVACLAWLGFGTVIERSVVALVDQALDSNGFAAQYVARTTASNLERRFEAVEKLSESEKLRALIQETLAREDLTDLLAALNSTTLPEEQLEMLRDQFRKHPAQEELQRQFTALLPDDMKAPDAVASWFYCSPDGLSMVRVPESTTVGKNFAWRSYFHGGGEDYDKSWRADDGKHISKTQLSSVFRSQATSRWIVAVATPVFDRSPDDPEKKFLGVVALTVEVGRFAELKSGADQFAVLVDCREGENKGLILQHPLFDKLVDEKGRLPDRFKDYRVGESDLPIAPTREKNYTDPMAADPEGTAYAGRWLARMEPVYVRGSDTGWTVIVQEAYATAIGSTLQALTSGLIRWGLIAVVLIALIMVGLWGWAARVSAN